MCIRDRRLGAGSSEGCADYYVVTLSPHSIGYKGMVLPDKLARFYTDLQRCAIPGPAGRSSGRTSGGTPW